MSKIDTFEKLLGLAEEDFWSDFQRASRFLQHGDIGTAREKTLGKFLKDQLPDRYRVESGEAIDCFGNQTGQIDLMIYDGLSTRPLMGSEGINVLLPAEALLATIEVKTKLTANEITNSMKGVGALHALEPWCEPWGRARQRGSAADDHLPRLLTTLFAYESDLGKNGWAEKEMVRVRKQAELDGVPVEYLDRVVVLNRGLLLPAKGDAAQTTESSGILSHWFFTLINFLAREVERRKAFPWADYEMRNEITFRHVAPDQYDAPAPKPRSRKQKAQSRSRIIKNSFKIKDGS